MTGPIARQTRSLTLLEVLLAGVIILVALPPLIQAAMGVARLDKSREGRSQGMHLAQVVLEQIHYRLHNEDCRGYRLNDSDTAKWQGYRATPPSYFAFFNGLGEADKAVVEPQGRVTIAQSRYFAQMFFQDNAVGNRSKMRETGLSVATNPEVARDISTYRVTVGVLNYLDSSSNASWPDGYTLSVKRPLGPKVDLAEIGVTISWNNDGDQQVRQTLCTRFTRPIFETDPTASVNGR